MADFDITDKLGGQPKYVWIIGGVGVAYAFVVYRQKKAGNTVAADTTNDQVNADVYGYQTGSSGGTGLASLNPTGVPGVIGITAPVAGKPVTPIPHSVAINVPTALGRNYVSALASQNAYNAAHGIKRA